MFWNYVTSTAEILIAAAFILGVPWIALCLYFPKISRVATLLGLLGFYTTLAYLKPAGVPVEFIPVLVVVLSLAFGWRKKKTSGHFFAPLRLLPVCAILVYCFLLFLFRWEPPGSDPIKWGSLARIFYEWGAIPGDTRPLSGIHDLKSASMGIPIPMALLFFERLLPLERIVNFFECATLAIFCFSLIQGLRIWFDEKRATWATFLSLTFFSCVEGYLVWGGTPTLMGMTCGFLILEWVKLVSTSRKAYFETIVFALALSYTVHSHPIGVYISVLVCGPIALFLALSQWKKIIPQAAILVVASLILLIPFFLHLDTSVSASELLEVRRWQELMSPFLFRPQYSWLYNMYSQLTAYVWNTAGVIGLVILVFAVTSKTVSRSFSLAAVFALAVIVFLVDNVHTWRFPLSYLLYPERVGTLLIFPLAGGVAWLIDQARRRDWKNVGVITARVTLAVVALLSVKQFHTRLQPLLGTSQFTKQDRQAIHHVSRQVPFDSCVGITRETPGIWIPVLAFRCTIPFHGLAMNVADEERSLEPVKTMWKYFSYSEKATPSRGKVVFDNGARIVTVIASEAKP